ncbi:MAG: NTP transferase domain-containing protein [Polyangiales bacterium]
MRACILAAGIGQRLRPLTDDRPKALVEVDGKSFLARMVTQLVAVGVTELVVATGYRQDAVEAALRDAPIPVVLRRNEAFDRTQNSVSLHACADALLAGGARDTFKLDGDVILDVEILRRLLGARSATGADLVAAVDPHRDSPLGAEEMKVEVTGGDRIVAFGKHLPPRTSAGESIGVELIAAHSVSSIVDALGALVTAGTTDLYYEDVYDRLLRARGGPLDARAVLVGDLPWTEVDTADDLARAGEIAARTRLH